MVSTATGCGACDHGAQGDGDIIAVSAVQKACVNQYRYQLLTFLTAILSGLRNSNAAVGLEMMC